VLAYTRDCASHVLGLDAREVRDGVPLKDLGLDSLMAVELRNVLGAELELEHPLPTTLVFDYPNIAAIADVLLQKLLATGTGRVPEPQHVGVQDRDASRVLQEVEELSDEEVELLLARRACT
jgi:acyl carrier protein